MRTLFDKLLQRYVLNRYFTAFGLFFAGGCAVAGCAPVPMHHHGHALAARRQPLAHLHLPGSSAAGRATALLLAAEFALEDHDRNQAAADYAKAAQLSNDPAIAKRALQFALVTRDPDTAAQLIERWQTLGADPKTVAGARARLAMLEGDRAQAEQQFGILLASGKPGDWKTFASDLLGARDTALAGQVLGDLAKPDQLPASESVWIALSQVAEQLGRHPLANRLADGAVRRFHSADGIRWAASLRMTAGDRAGALTLYARGVKTHPHNTDLRLAYAQLLGSVGKYAKALRVLAHGPQTHATWSARVAYAVRGKDEAALRRVYAALQREPPKKRVGDLFLLGQLAERLHHDQQALAWYRDVGPESRHAFEARVRRAVLLDQASQGAVAHTLVHQLEQNYAGDKDSMRVAYALDAELYSRHDEHAQAIAAYDRGLAALPHDPELLYGRGIEEADAGRTDAALKDFRQVLKVKPGDVDALNALGYTMADAGRDLPEATALLRRALAAKPDEAAVMDSWGWLQYRLGHYDQAEKYLRRAWDKSTNPDIGVHLGEALWKLGQHERARKIFAKVRKLDPHNAALLVVERKLDP